MTHAVGARELAIAAADALVVVHHHQTVIAVIGGPDRTNLDARRVLAMLTGDGAENALPVIQRRNLFNPRPGDIGRRVIIGVASRQTQVASHTFGLVDDHDPLVRWILRAFRRSGSSHRQRDYTAVAHADADCGGGCGGDAQFKKVATIDFSRHLYSSPFWFLLLRRFDTRSSHGASIAPNTIPKPTGKT